MMIHSSFLGYLSCDILSAWRLTVSADAGSLACLLIDALNLLLRHVCRLIRHIVLAVLNFAAITTSIRAHLLRISSYWQSFSRCMSVGPRLSSSRYSRRGPRNLLVYEVILQDFSHLAPLILNHFAHIDHKSEIARILVWLSSLVSAVLA